ncbi:Cobalt-precorrin-2 C(20)-methyltransferase [Pelotomaculum sp. FP]|uniref:precorrin-2 C(20)-methyltransferase n=1 Tax=Pelotomaculum sp. FP TaxID=261474 RepID=UPI0010661D04|nr:precorrin-2 C(20)-methyltransferase [Pelotomaculum sp. FP]TEB17401.1 Cobalt-precorrin-2 C(20)-methyltransferase [Pelotomaculum sp. FP]
MKGVFYGIGVGPGDPDLLTLKAVKLLQNVDVIIAPRTEKKEGSIALSIAGNYIREDTRILELAFPMVFDRSFLTEAWEQNKTVILDLLQEGKNVAFLTLGDPMLYSTYIYIYRLLEGNGITIETVPGITSFCAAASRLNFPLAEGNDILSIVPAILEEDKIATALSYSDNLVLMKVYKNYEQVAGQLKKHGFDGETVMISRCGFEDEEITYTLEGRECKMPNYLSTILAKKRSNGRSQ